MTICAAGISMGTCRQAGTDRVRHGPSYSVETEFPEGLVGRAWRDLADIVGTRRRAVDARPGDWLPGGVASDRFDLLHIRHRTDDRVRRSCACANQYALDGGGDRLRWHIAHWTGCRRCSACIAGGDEAPGQLKATLSHRPAGGSDRL